MTEQIKSAIETLERSTKCKDCSESRCIEYCENDYTDEDFNYAINVSIRSLKTWEDVLEKLETEKNKSYENAGFNYIGLRRAIDIINQHLAEIE